MFGRKKQRKTRREWQDAPDPGKDEVAPDSHAEPRQVTSVVQRVLAEAGCPAAPSGASEVRTATGPFEVTVAVDVAPLAFSVDALWTGELPATDRSVLHALNEWNAGHTVQRVHAELDGRGTLRVRADSVLTAGAGVTVRQLDEWVRRALAGLSSLAEFLAAQWPDVHAPFPEADDVSTGMGAYTGDLRLLVTPGNRYGLAGGPTPAVSLDRMAACLTADGVRTTATREEGASGRRGNGWLRPTGPDGGPGTGADIALHDGALSVTAGAALGEIDGPTADWVMSLCGATNVLPGGVVAVLGTAAGAGATLTCALHRPVGSGLSEAQLAEVLHHDRDLVWRRYRELGAEITGETGA
ncbi:YbjN domain-containing protein [Corynebacterium nuruki]|uniref:YbjN domain-containing protein n=1 Tax=Corynebacterium nuruki TaxID=1032851 RepID=UPI00024857D0|nr:YbjN domain-containing protein [Corynebacterium nuruki]